MGGSVGCCVEKEPHIDHQLNTEAMLTRQSEVMIYKTKSDIQQNQNRNSLVLSKSAFSEDDFVSNTSRTQSRASFDSSYDSQSTPSDGDIGSNVKNSKNRHKKHKKKRHKRKRHKKKRDEEKNEFVIALEECIEDFNDKLQSINVLQLMSDTKFTNEVHSALSDFNQSEVLDPEQIATYFQNNDYNIQKFLLIKRNTFIKMMVNKWPNYTILTAIKIYEMLQEKISNVMPSVSKSSTNIYSV